MSGSHTLLTYASKQGSTAEIAEAVARHLIVMGMSVDLIPMAEVDILNPYDNLIIGAPIYSAKWLSEATDFVKKHQRMMPALNVACFVLAIRLRLDDQGIRDAVMNAITTQRVMMKPVSIGLFAGKIDYSTLSPITRLEAETKELPEGDFRDWDVVEAWAKTLPPLLDG